jgi:hypothetical protein
MDISKLIEAYDTYFGDEPLDPNKLTDEEIDDIIGLETDLGKAVDGLIIAKKLFANRRQILEKKEKVATKMIARILKKLGEQSWENEDGRAVLCPSYVFDIDMDKLPKEYLSSNRSKINWALAKGESITGVTVTDSHGYIRVY